jgi:3'(2'), 5'-bisphosphate nucleotidase
MTDYGFQLEQIKQIAIEAGNAIIEVYETAFEDSIQQKDNNTPVTIADLRAHNLIKEGLEALSTKYPVFSEEGAIPDFEDRKNIECFWLVDPLDGTKEFIKKNGDFTVNIALIHKNKSVFGCLYVPVTGQMFWGIKGQGAWSEYKGIVHNMSVESFSDSQKGIRVLTSRSHVSSKIADYVLRFELPVILQRGSSVKMMLIADGKADMYPRFGPTMEWDTAAAQIILEEAGGRIFDMESGKALAYNKKSLFNPEFIALGKKV